MSEPVGLDNPLRQVIVNTHSPSIVLQVPEDTLIVAEPKEIISAGKRLKGIQFSCLPETWRAKESSSQNSVCRIGDLLAYLNPVLSEHDLNQSFDHGFSKKEKRGKKKKRVIDRSDMQKYFAWFQPESSDQNG